MTKLVFIVEDDRDIRDSLSVLLELQGFSVASAENGKVALEFLKKGDIKPGIILLDLMMPVMDGKAFLSEIQNLPELSLIPIVVLTAGSEKIEAKNVMDFIKKPLNFNHLLSVLEKYVS